MNRRTFSIGKWLPVWICALLLSASAGWAQEISGGEYFWDADPGLGFGIPISVLDGNFDEVCETALANTATLPGSGLHTFSIRLQDTSLTWGPTFSVVLTVVDSLPAVLEIPEITQGEFFWDTDPGIGAATPLLALDGNFEEAMETAFENLTTYPGSGLHTFHIRLLDNENNWGPDFAVVITLADSVTADFPNIVEAEYFWDTDPGIGLGTPLLALDGNFEEALETAYENVTTYPGTGVHAFNIRLRDDSNNWGPAFAVVTNIEDSVTSLFPEVTQAEFFWDTDPGAGLATPLLALDGNFNEAIEVAFANLNTYPGSGLHTFNIRALDNNTNWGPVFSVVITLEDSVTADFPNLVQGEGYWDTDPGIGNGLPFLSLDGNFEEALETAVNNSIQTFALTLGPHAFYSRLMDDDGNWGPSFGVVVWIDTSLVPVIQSVAGPNRLCENDNLSGVAYSTPNDPNTTYTWTLPSGGTIVSGQGTANITVNWNTPGSYTLSVQGCDTNGCGNVFDLGVIIDPSPNAGILPAGPLTICAGDTDTLFAQNVGSLGVQWLRNNSPVSGATDSVFVASTSGNYQVVLTGAGSCADTSSVVTVTALPVLVADAGPDKVQCLAGATVTLGGSPAASGGSGVYSYAWTPTAGLTNPTIAQPAADQVGTYTLTVTDGNGCTASDQVVVTLNPIMMIDPGSDTLICPGQTTPLGGAPSASGGSGGFTYAWTPISGISNATISNPSATPTATTNYTLTVTDGVGCQATSNIVVTLNPAISLNAGADIAICPGDSTPLGGSPTANGGAGGYQFSWTPATGLSSTTTSNVMAAPLSNTTYQLSVSDLNNCVALDTVTVSVNTVNAVATGGTTICEGSSTPLTATGGVSYSWSPSTGLSNATIANPIASPLTTTTYTVTVTTGAGCTDTASVTVNVDPAITAIAANDTAICLGTSGQLTASGGASYAWTPTIGLSNPNIANPVMSPTSQVTYQVTVTAGTCTSTDTTRVEVQSVTASISNDTTVCQGNSATLLAMGGDLYLWSPAASLSSPVVDNPTATPSVSTTYSVTVSDLIGCSDTASVTVIIDPAINVTANADTTVCTGGSVQLQATGGGAYAWSPSTGLNNPNIANPTATPGATTTYTVQVTAGACVDQASTTVTVSSVSASALGSTTICEGSSTNLTATGGTTYSWSPATGLSNPNSATPVASPTVTTTYVVTVGNSAGCTDTASVTVIVDPAITASTGNNVSICQGSSTQLTASGGTTYSWSPSTGLSNANIADPIASPSSTTTYTVTVGNGSTCTDQASATVTVDAPVTAVVNNDTTICSGTNAQLSASGGTNYVWSPTAGLSNPNVANPTASPSANTTYTVTVSAGACSDLASTVVSVNSVTATASGGATICEGSSTPLSASGGTNFLWSPSTGLSSPNSATPTASPTVTTTYTVTVSDATGCSGTASVTVIVDPTVVATASADTTICSAGAAQLSASGGAAYSWSPTTGLSNPNIANPVATPSSTTTYTVTVTGGTCSGTASTTVTVNSVTATASGGTTLCQGSSTGLTASGGTTYSWSPATGLSNPNSATPTATPLSTTTYVVTVGNGSGCTDTASVTVVVDQPISASAGNNVAICQGNSTTLLASGGTTYSWSPTTGLSNPSIANPIATPTATTTYTVTVGNGSTCTGTADVTVTVDAPVTAVTGNDTTICSGTSAQLSASGGATYLWTPGVGLSNVNSANPTASPPATTTYSVTVTTGACSDVASTTVTVNTVNATATGTTTICEGSSTPLSASGGISYQWTPGTSLSNPISATPTATPITTTTYSVTVTDAAGCSDVATVTVTVDPAITATANADTAICAGSTAQLSATGGSSYSWSPTTGLSNPLIANPIASPTSTTTYTVTVTGGLCTGTASTTVTLNPLPAAGFTSSTNQDTAFFTNLSVNATSYLWDFGDSQTSTDVNPEHIYAVAGIYPVCLIATNSCGSDTSCMDVNVSFMGIQPVWAGATPELFPNPNRGSFTLRVPGLRAGRQLEIRLISALGVTVWRSSEAATGDFERLIQPDGLSSGVYFLELRSEGEMWRRKVLIER